MNMDLDPKMQVRLLRGCVEDGDLLAVQRLLDQGCSWSHPETGASPLATALKLGNAGIVDALLDAGARLDQNELSQSITWAILHDNARFIAESIEHGEIPKSHLNGLMLEAASKGGGEAVGLRLLDLGANPLLGDAKGQTALDHAVTRSRDGLVSSIFERCSQGQKNKLLVQFVQYGMTRCVRKLLDAGANPDHVSNGRTLLQIAPREADELKRLLRAAKTGASLEAAMADARDSSASPAKGTFTL